MGNCFGTIMSQVIYIAEKFSMWISLCSMITYMILCLIVMLAFGVGLGYNYSFVDHKSKHIYVAKHYKTVRPTNYYGPGYYKPTTQNPRLTKRSRKKPKFVRADEEPEVIEIAREFTENLPSGNPAELVKAEASVPLRLESSDQGPPFHRLYFTFSKPQLTTNHRFVRKFNNSFVSISDQIDKNETEVKADNAVKSSSYNFHHINTTDDTGSEAIRVDVANVTDAGNLTMSKFTMSMKQLLSFFSRLRDEKKTFSVQVIAL